MRGFLSMAAVLLAACATAHAADEDAASYVQAFCSLRGLDGGQAYLLSPSLTETVNAALAKNAEIQQAHPDEKPPLGDGVPYQSYPDYAPECGPGIVTRQGDTVIAEVKYAFPDAPAANWTDRLALVPEPGGALVIDDIFYGASGEEDTLRKALEAAFAQ